MDATAILFAAFIFLMLLNVPIALCLGISAIVGIIVMNVPLSVVLSLIHILPLREWNLRLATPSLP